MKYFQLSTLLLFFTTCIYYKSYKDETILSVSNDVKITNLMNSAKIKNKEIADLQERLTIYYLITLEQNKILERFQSSREAKKKNKKLQDLQLKLN